MPLVVRQRFLIILTNNNDLALKGSIHVSETLGLPRVCVSDHGWGDGLAMGWPGFRYRSCCIGRCHVCICLE